MSLIDIIKGCSLFHELYDNEIDTILKRAQVLNLTKDEIIFKEGDDGNEIFIILSGSATVKKANTTLATLKKGDLFGELVLLNENLRTADIVANEHTDILVLTYDNIFGLFKTNPSIFSLLILNLARILTVRLKNTGQNLKEVRQELEELKKKVSSL